MKKLLLRLYSRFLFWKWDREYYAAARRMRGCNHERTMFVDVGSPPYDCVEKCCDCWAIRVPNLVTNEMEWFPNMANPKRSKRAA